jgi:hypothetical protein
MQPDGRLREGRKHDRHGVSPNVLPPWTKALVTKLLTDPVRNVSAFSTKRLETAVIADHSLLVCILRVGGHVDRSRDGHSTVALYQ